jgi:hypothetical protein
LEFAYDSEYPVDGKPARPSVALKDLHRRLTRDWLAGKITRDVLP